MKQLKYEIFFLNPTKLIYVQKYDVDTVYIVSTVMQSL